MGLESPMAISNAVFLLSWLVCIYYNIYIYQCIYIYTYISQIYNIYIYIYHLYIYIYIIYIYISSIYIYHLLYISSICIYIPYIYTIYIYIIMYKYHYIYLSIIYTYIYILNIIYIYVSPICSARTLQTSLPHSRCGSFFKGSSNCVLDQWDKLKVGIWQEMPRLEAANYVPNLWVQLKCYDYSL